MGVQKIEGFLERDMPEIFQELLNLKMGSRVYAINTIREALHQYSPFKNEPVDCVLWIENALVEANDYNPNSVAPPEMRLLEHSITEDGYTQPIVAWSNDDKYTVVDGFHRHRVGRECKSVAKRVHGYLPLAVINSNRVDRNDRIAATIRHNRARGKHKVEGMSDIVVELKRRNWSDDRIGKELGMDPDEVLRLTQITGLAEMFAEQEFSVAWEHSGAITEVSIDDAELDEDAMEWMDNIVTETIHKPGWRDRTENSSVLHGKRGEHRGCIQKSRFNDEWFWYAYTQPMQEGRASTRILAKKAVERAQHD